MQVHAFVCQNTITDILIGYTEDHVREMCERTMRWRRTVKRTNKPKTHYLIQLPTLEILDVWVGFEKTEKAKSALSQVRVTGKTKVQRC